MHFTRLTLCFSLPDLQPQRQNAGWVKSVQKRRHSVCVSAVPSLLLLPHAPLGLSEAMQLETGAAQNKRHCLDRGILSRRKSCPAIFNDLSLIQPIAVFTLPRLSSTGSYTLPRLSSTGSYTLPRLSSTGSYTLPRLSSTGSDTRANRRSRSGSRKVRRVPRSSHSPTWAVESTVTHCEMQLASEESPPHKCVDSQNTSSAPQRPTRWIDIGPDDVVSLMPQHLGFEYLNGMRAGAADARTIDRLGNFGRETGSDDRGRCR